LYKNAFAMTFLSMFGPDNLPPLEAMALGCPVICADAKGIKDQLDVCALFFNPVDESELAQKIKLICESEDVREIFVNRGIEMASNLTVDKYVKAAIVLFDEFAPIRECWSSKEKYKHL
jgi:glycosyltransferase involved in cell wall biosynthesis